jgi:carboxylesterase
MIEFGVLAAAWLVLLVWASRKGTKHLLAKHVGVTLPVAGGVCAALLEALPTMAISPGFTIRTAIAVLAGVFAGRLFGKVAILWAAGHEKRAAGDPSARPPRLVHPLIAAGLFVAGVPTLWHVVTSNYALIEELSTPRDETTGIVHGSEEFRFEDGEEPRDLNLRLDVGVLLIHGLYGSPTDFGELPERASASFTDVHAPLLPGHGRTPDSLDAVWAQDYRKFVRTAYDELAAKHRSVVVVGGSMGAALAVHVAAERKPAALVLVSPYFGRLATPSWCPVSFDSLVGPLSRVTRRMIVDQDMRGRRYASQSLHALRQARDLGLAADAAAAGVSCPTLVLVGSRDVIVSPQSTLDWTAARIPTATTWALASSGHDLFNDVDGDKAVEATVKFLVENAKR